MTPNDFITGREIGRAILISVFAILVFIAFSRDMMP